MPKLLKTFFYIVGCSLVFIFIVGTYQNVSPSYSQPKTAVAFEWEKQVSVYFWNDNLASDKNDCSLVFPVSRTVLNAETLGPGALETLLKGVTNEEKALGYGTAFPGGVLVQKFEIKNKVAYIDFSSELSRGVAGACRVIALRSQIETTLNNLPDIDSVVISVDDEIEEILQP